MSIRFDLMSRSVVKLPALGCLAVLLTACDPAFSIKARQYLPMPNPGPAIAGEPSRDNPRFDPDPLADCLEATLDTLDGVSDVRRNRSSSGIRVRREGMNFAVNGYPWSERAYGNVWVIARDRERPWWKYRTPG